MRPTPIALLLGGLASSAACHGQDLAEEPETSLTLPPPEQAGGTSLRDALAHRRSVRSFTDEPLSLADASQLLWAAHGVTDSRGLRTTPSAGALYPFEVYLLASRVEGLQPGLYHHRVGEHRLDLVRPGLLAEELSEAALGQIAVRDAALSLILIGVVQRTAVKYGRRASRYVFMEGGGMVQSILLQAVDLELGGVCIGAFRDDAVQALIGTDDLPVAIIPVGRPAE